MKFKKGDKVLLVCVRNVYGVDFNCVLGKLVSVKTQQWTTNKIVQLEANRWLFIRGEADMKKKVIDLPLGVWTIKHLTPENKEHIRELRKTCQVLSSQLQGYSPQVKAEQKVLKN